MNCIILAAGFGSRLKELTKNKPKALIEINGKILLDTQIESALSIGVENIYIITGYKSNLIEKHIQEKYIDKVRLIKNFNFANSNSAFSWLLAAPFICDKPCLHLNCDILFSNDALLKLVSSFNKDKISTIACRNDLALKNNMEQIIIDNENFVRTCINKYDGQLSGKAYGMCIFSSKVNKEHFRILSSEISNGKIDENFFQAIRLNCLNSKYKALLLSSENIHEFNYIEDLRTNKV